MSTDPEPRYYTEEMFTAAIESIRLQFEKDKEYSERLSIMFNIKDGVVPTYDNDSVVKSLISTLQFLFPKDADGFCEIEHYIYDLNFGKACIEDDAVLTPEDLFYRLTTKSNGN